VLLKDWRLELGKGVCLANNNKNKKKKKEFQLFPIAYLLGISAFQFCSRKEFM